MIVSRTREFLPLYWMFQKTNLITCFFSSYQIRILKCILNFTCKESILFCFCSDCCIFPPRGHEINVCLYVYVWFPSVTYLGLQTGKVWEKSIFLTVAAISLIWFFSEKLLLKWYTPTIHQEMLFMLKTIFFGYLLNMLALLLGLMLLYFHICQFVFAMHESLI